MCWKSKIKPLKQIADTDIPVIKTLLKHDDYNNYGIYYSCYQNFKYKIGETYDIDKHSLKVESKNIHDIYIIRNGYHSYDSKCTISTEKITGMKFIKWNKDFSVDVHDKLTVLALFNIPKGSKYYENENGEIVSNKIKFIGIIQKIKEDCPLIDLCDFKVEK